MDQLQEDGPNLGTRPGKRRLGRSGTCPRAPPSIINALVPDRVRLEQNLCTRDSQIATATTERHHDCVKLRVVCVFARAISRKTWTPTRTTAHSCQFLNLLCAAIRTHPATHTQIFTRTYTYTYYIRSWWARACG